MKPRWTRLAFTLVWSVLAGIGIEHVEAVDVAAHHNNLSRDGLYIDPGFTLPHSAGLKRDTNFSGNISGNVYAQPLYIENGPGKKAMVIVATEANNVYALDALNQGRRI
jgi:hypothetical protein